ncbi:MAG: type II/IV secretion system ATPase subunit [Metallosphaera sp.]
MPDLILEEYNVLGSVVTIVDSDGKGLYIIKDPQLSTKELEIINEILDEVYSNTKSLTDAEMRLMEILAKRDLDPKLADKAVLLFKKRILYDEITIPMIDPDVEEIECTGPGLPITVIHRKYSNYMRLYTNIVLPKEENVIKILEKLATKSNKSVNIARPYLEFSLDEGHRVTATISKEISNPGSTFDVRKFPISPLSLIKLIKMKSLSVEIASYLWFLMDYKPFYLIVGSTGSGKTTFLNALLNFTNPDSKVLSIEDTPELNLVRKNWIRLFTRQSVSSNFDVSVNDLSRLALRYRPDYLIIGEVRGKEIETLIHAAASGHASLSTFHGAKPADVITRVASLLPKDLAVMFLANVWGFIIVGRRVTEDGKITKAINAIYETTRTKGKTKFRKIVWWSFKNNKYSPSDLNTLVTRSSLLLKISHYYGLTQKEILDELNERVEFIKSLLSSNTIDNEIVQEEIGKFYRSRKLNVTSAV